MANPEVRIADRSVAVAGNQRLSEARRFAIDAAKLLASTRCHSVAVLDVSGVQSECDFFVLATGTSARQMRSVAQEVIELSQTRNFAPLNESGLDGETWVLVDCVDVIVHIFNDESRQYYDLDNLWGDARPVAWDKE
jgi:ribosome-associated protein